MSKKIKVGIIGLGRIYPRHVDDSIKQLDELELVAVCDTDKEILKEVAEKEGVKAYNDYKELVDDEDVELVAIITPNGYHFEMASYVAEKNKHCVLEKPISQDYETAKILVEKFEKSKGTLFPVMQVRYNPVIRTVRKYVKDGSLGKILSGGVVIRWTRPQTYFAESDWKGSKNMDGGSLLTQAIHYIDVMQFILGEVESVYGKVDRKKLDIEVEDMANAIIDFKSGARLNLEFTVNTYPHNLESSLTILGEKGSVKIGGKAMNELEFWHVEDIEEPIIDEGLTPNVYAGGMYVGSCPNHKSIYENVINVLLKEEQSFITGGDALEAIKIIDAIKKSSDEKKEVEL